MRVQACLSDRAVDPARKDGPPSYLHPEPQLTAGASGQVAAPLALRGKVVIKEAARAVSARDDRLLAEKMEKLQKAQEDEDSDSGSEDETMGDVDIEKQTGLTV